MKLKQLLFSVFILSLLIFTSSCKEGFNKKLTNVFEKKYVSKEGKFKIAFPNTPKLSNEKIPYSTGNVTIPVYMFLDEEKPIKSAVIYADYPAGILKGIDIDAQKVLAGAKDGALSSMAASMGNYVVEGQKDVKVNDSPGIYFKARFENGLHVIYELVLVNDRLYQIRMLNEKEYPTNEVSDNFFNSFEIIK